MILLESVNLVAVSRLLLIVIPAGTEFCNAIKIHPYQSWIQYRGNILYCIEAHWQF
ncbi:hypothetical protein KC19_3G176200 [Ceratodon purpureus]|uniref:Uncharacterized protein n=1 Tax=Ceratodon purpureus TaxID=3225 RepID=A0A8T0IM79_CERPU|nr:hypothetical protein KC19_3G176200 [Ceratodon purpureus]